MRGWRKYREHQAAGARAEDARKRGDLTGHATAQREADNLFDAIGAVATAESHSIPDAARKDIARSAMGKSARASSSHSRSKAHVAESESKAAPPTARENAPAESFDAEFDAAEFRLDSDARTAATAASVGNALRDVYATPKTVARIGRIASYTHTPPATVERVFDQHLALRAGRDLATVADGGRIPPQRLAKLRELGLVSFEEDASGRQTGVARLNADALRLVPRDAGGSSPNAYVSTVGPLHGASRGETTQRENIAGIHELSSQYANRHSGVARDAREERGGNPNERLADQFAMGGVVGAPFLRALPKDYWIFGGGGMSWNDAKSIVENHGLGFEQASRTLGTRFDPDTNSVKISRGDMRNGLVHRVMLAEEIQHGLDGRLHAARAYASHINLIEYHIDLFQRILNLKT